MIDLTKHYRAIEGLNRWKGARGKGTLEYVTGFGKTRVGLLLIQEVINKYPQVPILILVPSDAVRKVWQNAISKEDEYISFTDEQLSFIWIQTPTGLTTAYFEASYKLVVVDEIHKFTSDERYKLFSKLDYKSILGLTGTYPAGRYAAMLNTYCPVVDTIYEREALANNWISNFVEYNIRCELTDEDKARYEKFSIPIHETLTIFKDVYRKFRKVDNTFLFHDDYHVISSCKSGLKTLDSLGKPLYIPAADIRLSVALFMGWTADLDITTEWGESRNRIWHPDAIKDRVHVFADFIDKRLTIINNNDVKLRKVIEIFKKFPNKTICFNESTEFADRIAESVNNEFGKHIATVYHTNIESRPLWDNQLNDYIRYGSGAKKGQIKICGQKTLKDAAIEGLINNTYQMLLTARALNEGLDIPTIEQVITTAGTANPIDYAQRGGRGKRVDIYNPDKITKIFNLYFDDFMGSNDTLVKSRDKQKLIGNQESRGSTVKWIDDLDEISDS